MLSWHFWRQTPSSRGRAYRPRRPPSLYAEWTGPGDTLLGVRFTESGEVQYALFAPNTLHKDRMDRASGITTPDTLMEKLAYLPDQRWLSE